MKEVKLETKRITHEEAVKVRNEVSNILLAYAVLLIAVADIKYEFDAVGKYRQRRKALINDIEKKVVALFNSLRYRLIKADNRNVVYDKWNSKVCEAVDEAVLLEAPERSVNIALACCRLILAEGNKMGKLYIEEVPPLAGVIVKLERLGVRDYHLDSIIERTISML